MIRKRMRCTGLAALICAGMLSAAGCASNTAGGDLAADAFAGYSLEGGNLVDVAGISGSGNDEPEEHASSQSSADSAGASGTEQKPDAVKADEEQTPDNPQGEAYSSLEETDLEETLTTDASHEEQITSEDEQPGETADPLNGITAVAQVEKWVNVRVEPNTESGIVGKIYNNCAATIIDEVDGEGGSWYYMTSGNVTGYVKAEYFIIGDEAEALKGEIGLTFARVIVENLRVRTTPDLTTDENIVTMYPMGTEVAVLSHDDEWALIETDAISTGYVHVSCIEMWTEFDVAITLEEEAQAEAERLQAEEDARAAEEAYRTLLAQQQAETSSAQTESAAPETPAETQPASTQAPAETQPVPAETTAPPETTTTAPPETTPAPAPSVSDTDVNTALRNAIVAFALQFNGCPYVHGGRSLSQGTDCSGFTNMIYQNFGYNLDWTPAGQANLGVRIDYHDAKPGDLLFYSNSQKYLGHVALYIGNGQIIHAANEQYGICIWDMNYREPLFAVSIIN